MYKKKTATCPDCEKTYRGPRAPQAMTLHRVRAHGWSKANGPSPRLEIDIPVSATNSGPATGSATDPAIYINQAITDIDSRVAWLSQEIGGLEKLKAELLTLEKQKRLLSDVLDGLHHATQKTLDSAQKTI